MDLPVDAARLTGSSEPITVWTAASLNSYRSNPVAPYLYQAIDAMGLGSKVSQGINAVLTSVERLKANPSHKLYILCVDKKCVGILKIGTKKLFIRRHNGSLVEMEPMCALDFYVHEAEQRHGYGKVLFEFMLQQERLEPRLLAIDRPSPKFLKFLSKYYNLNDFVAQSNNFVVFNRYFESQEGTATCSNAIVPLSTTPDSGRRTLHPKRTSVGNVFGETSAASATWSNAQQDNMPQRHLGAAISANVMTTSKTASYGDGMPSNRPQWEGASQSAGAGGAMFAPPPARASSRELQATLSREAPLTSSAVAGRRGTTSPTRSGYGYNIINLQEEAPVVRGGRSNFR